MPATAAKTAKSLAAQIGAHLKTLERAKQLYDRADAQLAEIVKPFLETCKTCGLTHLKPNSVIVLNQDDKKAELKDNYTGESIVWGHGGVRRFAVKLSKS